MTTAIYNFPIHSSGDMFEGTEFTIKVNNVLKDLRESTVSLFIDGVVFLSTSNGITLTDPQNGKFTIDRQIITMTPGIHRHKITINFGAGTVKTYIKGTWKITN
jgi:hypothetical protein